jgi:hypothetical protein
MWGALLSFLFITAPARADMLYVGLNDTPGEVDAARRAALARHERFFQLPVLDPKLEAEIAKKLVVTQDLFKKMSLVQKTDPAAFDKLSLQYDVALKDLADAREKAGYTQERFTADLQRLRGQGANLTALVISGHDGNGEIFGADHGKLTSTAVMEAFRNAAPVGERIRTFAMFGCYTGNMETLLQHWMRVLPHLGLVGGFPHSAPLGNVRAGQDYMTDFLVKSDDIIRAGDDKAKLWQIAQGLKGLQALVASKHDPAFLLACGDNNYVTAGGVTSQVDLVAQCRGKITPEITARWAERVTCFMTADKGCENPPEDTSHHELRTIYNEVQEGKHCQKLLGSEAIFMPVPSVLMRLIFGRNVLANIDANEKDFIARLDATLPAGSRFGSIARLTRAELLRKYRDAYNWKNDMVNDPAILSGPRGRELLAFEANLSKFEDTINFQEQCVPVGWVEPQSTEKAPCAKSFEPSEVLEKNLKQMYWSAVVTKAHARQDVVDAKTRYDKTFPENGGALSMEQARAQREALDAYTNLISRSELDLITAERARLQHPEGGVDPKPFLEMLDQYEEPIRGSLDPKAAARAKPAAPPHDEEEEHQDVRTDDE